MFHDAVIAAIRTGVAALVGLIVAFLVSSGFDLGDEFSGALTTALSALIIALYNYGVIMLEKHINPIFGYLLGIPKAPSYEN